MSAKVSEQIRLLKELQQIDLQIREIERAKSDIPQKRTELRSARERERADIQASKAQTSRNDEEAARLEKEIAWDQEALQAFEARTADFTSPEAYQAALRELDTRRRSIREKEETVVRRMEEREVLLKKVAQLEADFANVEKEYERKEQELELTIADVDKQTEGLRSQRAQMAAGIDRSLLARYDQVFKRRDGMAVVAVRGEVCQGCDMGVPPQIANFARSGEQGVQSCPHCSRILVWEPIDPPEGEKPRRARGRPKKATREEEVPLDD